MKQTYVFILLCIGVLFMMLFTSCSGTPVAAEGEASETGGSSIPVITGNGTIETEDSSVTRTTDNGTTVMQATEVSPTSTNNSGKKTEASKSTSSTKDNTTTSSQCVPSVPQEQMFADNCVLVVIKHEDSYLNKPWKPNDFSNVDILSVTDLTYLTGDPYSKELLNYDQFRQILKIELKQSGKEKVLEAIDLLKEYDFVEFAEPDYFTYADLN